MNATKKYSEIFNNQPICVGRRACTLPKEACLRCAKMWGGWTHENYRSRSRLKKEEDERFIYIQDAY